jgi:signal transduction histidine kinase
MVKILVVDDEKIIRERLKKLLEMDGYRAFVAGNGQEGLEVFNREKPEISLLDIKMPGMDGIEMLERIKEKSKTAEVIMVTGHGGVDTAIQAMKGGAFGYIQKPIEYDELGIEIGRVLSKQEVERKRREAEEKLSKSRESFHNIVERNVSGMLVLDRDGMVQFVNPAAERLFARDKEKLINQYLGFPIVAGNVTELDIFRSSGESGIAEMRIVDTEWEGKPAYLAMLEDVTERKRSEEALRKKMAEIERLNHELKELDRLKSDFISTVSHELRTPLTTFQSIISSLLAGVLGEFTDLQKEYLLMAKDESAREARLINNLLDLSKLESGKVILQKEMMDVTALADEIIRSMRPGLDEKRIILRRKFPQNLPKIYVDPGRIMEVFTNLLSNAIKFTKENGQVIVSAKITRDDKVKLEVADTGIGIAKENIPKLFSKFFQAEQTTNPGGKGTGLGLAICKEVIELHGGDIWVESEIGKGSKFTFILPIGKGE